jgi:membrane protease YdiL (CAAX protease family)
MLAAGNLAQLSDPALALRLGGPITAALAAGFAVDRLCERKGLLPPGLRIPWRRGTAFALLAGVLWVGVFRPLGEFGLDLNFDPSKISTPQLFLLHGLLAAVVLAWFALGFVAVPGSPQPLLEPVRPVGPAAAPEPAPPPQPSPSFGAQLAAQLGFRTPDVGREIGIGLLLGAGAWAVVVAALIVIAIVIWALHGENALPKEPPALVPWIAALPIGVRLLVSLSAGFVEETFFRGFLQPRIGIALSTAMFAMAHLSYGQPFMLVGITLLSLIYAFLVRWRQTVWPAIAAHTLFDGVQLLLIIPIALRVLGKAVPGATAGGAALLFGWFW